MQICRIWTDLRHDSDPFPTIHKILKFIGVLEAVARTFISGLAR